MPTFRQKDRFQLLLVCSKRKYFIIRNVNWRVGNFSEQNLQHLAVAMATDLHAWSVRLSVRCFLANKLVTHKAQGIVARIYQANEV